MKTPTKNKTLLDQMKEAPVTGGKMSKLIDPDVAIAWLKGEIRGAQIVKTLWPGKRISSCATLQYCFLNRSLREAYRLGKIKIVE